MSDMTHYVVGVVNQSRQHFIEVEASGATANDNLVFYEERTVDGDKRERVVATFTNWAWYAEKDALQSDDTEDAESDTDPMNEPILSGQEVSKGPRRG